MEPKLVDFSIIKQKTIKTDEVLKMYLETEKKLKKSYMSNKNLKALINTINNRLKLETERYTFINESTNTKCNELQSENQTLMEQKTTLEKKYSSLLVDSQSSILELENELKMIKDLNASAARLSESPKSKNTQGSYSSKKFKELEVKLKMVEENEQKLKEDNERLLLENKQAIERISQMKSEHSRSFAVLQMEKSRLECEVKQLCSKIESDKFKQKILSDKENEISKLKAEVLALRELKEQINHLKEQIEKLNSDVCYKDVALNKAKEELQQIQNIIILHAESQTASKTEAKSSNCCCNKRDQMVSSTTQTETSTEELVSISYKEKRHANTAKTMHAETQTTEPESKCNCIREDSLCINKMANNIIEACHVETQTVLSKCTCFSETQSCKNKAMVCSFSQTEPSTVRSVSHFNTGNRDDIVDCIFREMIFSSRMLSPVRSTFQDDKIIGPSLSLPDITGNPPVHLEKEHPLLTEIPVEIKNNCSVPKVEREKVEIGEDYLDTEMFENHISLGRNRGRERQLENVTNVLDIRKPEDNLVLEATDSSGLNQNGGEKVPDSEETNDLRDENNSISEELNEQKISEQVNDKGFNGKGDDRIDMKTNEKDITEIEKTKDIPKAKCAAPIEKLLRKKRSPTIHNSFIKRHKFMKHANKRGFMKKVYTSRKLKTQDSVLRALQVLKQSKINFTISNESTLPLLLHEHDWLNKHCRTSTDYVPPPPPVEIPKVPKTKEKQSVEKLKCSSSCCNNMLMLLSGKPNDPNLHGFFNVKKKQNSPLNSRMEITTDEKSENTLKWLNESLKTQITPENLLDTLAELVSQKLRDNNTTTIKRKRRFNSENSDFFSETETEIERLFPNPKNTLETNKMLYKKAKFDTETETTSSSEDSNLKNISSQTVESLNNFNEQLEDHEETIPIIHPSKSPVKNLQIELQTPNKKTHTPDSYSSFRFTIPPDILSPLSACSVTESPKLNIVNAKEIVKIIEFKSPLKLDKMKIPSLFLPVKFGQFPPEKNCSVMSPGLQKLENSFEVAMENYLEDKEKYNTLGSFEKWEPNILNEKNNQDEVNYYFENNVDGIVELENVNKYPIETRTCILDNTSNSLVGQDMTNIDSKLKSDTHTLENEVEIEHASSSDEGIKESLISNVESNINTDKADPSIPEHEQTYGIIDAKINISDSFNFSTPLKKIGKEEKIEIIPKSDTLKKSEGELNNVDSSSSFKSPLDADEMEIGTSIQEIIQESSITDVLGTPHSNTCINEFLTNDGDMSKEVGKFINNFDLNRSFRDTSSFFHTKLPNIGRQLFDTQAILSMDIKPTKVSTDIIGLSASPDDTELATTIEDYNFRLHQREISLGLDLSDEDEENELTDKENSPEQHGHIISDFQDDISESNNQLNYPMSPEDTDTQLFENADIKIIPLERTSVKKELQINGSQSLTQCLKDVRSNQVQNIPSLIENIYEVPILNTMKMEEDSVLQGSKIGDTSEIKNQLENPQSPEPSDSQTFIDKDIKVIPLERFTDQLLNLTKKLPTGKTTKFHAEEPGNYENTDEKKNSIDEVSGMEKRNIVEISEPVTRKRGRPKKQKLEVEKTTKINMEQSNSNIEISQDLNSCAAKTLILNKKIEVIKNRRKSRRLSNKQKSAESKQMLSKEFIDSDSSDLQDSLEQICVKTDVSNGLLTAGNSVDNTATSCDGMSSNIQRLIASTSLEKPPTSKRPRIKPVSKLKSNVLKQMNMKRKMFQTNVPSSSARSIESNCDFKNSELDKLNLEVKDIDSEVRINMDSPEETPLVRKRITVVQNLLISPGDSNPVGLLKSIPNGTLHEASSSQNNVLSAESEVTLLKKKASKTSLPNSCDILSQIMGEMNKNRPDVIVKPKIVNKDVPSGTQEKQWRSKILDIAEVVHKKNEQLHDSYGKLGSHVNASGLLKKGSQLTDKMQLIVKKLVKIPNEDEIPPSIILEFKRLTLDVTINLIIHEISQDFRDKPIDKYYPAPLMTRTQRTYLNLLVALEKEMTDDVLEKFLTKTEQHIFRTGCGLNAVVPLTRLFLAICRLKADINRMRTFCCEAFFYVGNLAIPILFTVLTSWIEVIPMATDVENYPIATVLVQLVHLKNFFLSGYNLIPLRCLLHQYHGYPKERQNCDELFEQVFHQYLRNPTPIASFAIRLYCRNKENKWVYKKLDEFFKPLIYKIPMENVNFKATVILLMGKICNQFKPKDEQENACLDEMNRFFLGLLEDDMPDLVRKSVLLSMNDLPKKRFTKKKKSEDSKKKSEGNTQVTVETVKNQLEPLA